VRSRERPEGASGSTEVAARAASEASEQDRLPAVAVLCGAGLKGAVARTKHDDASTGTRERAQ